MQKKIGIQDIKAYVNISFRYVQNLVLHSCHICRIIQKNFFATKEQVIKYLLPLLIVCLGFYSCTSSQKVINRNIDEIFVISDQIREYYTNKPDYWGLSTAEVIQKKIIADKFLNNGKIIISGHNEILIGQGEDAGVVMPRSTSFDIVLSKLTKAQCMSYAEKKLSNDKEVKLIGIQIINNKGKTSFEWGGQPGLPIKKYASKDLCADDNNTLIWSVK